MFPVRYELGFISHKGAFFIAIAVKTSNLSFMFVSPKIQSLGIISILVTAQELAIEPGIPVQSGAGSGSYKNKR
jgi:hypothetical protein